MTAAVSRYGISRQPLRLCYQVTSVGLAVTAIALRIALGGSLHAPGSRSVLLALSILAAGRLFVGWIPMDAPGHPTTRIGVIHVVLGAISFTSAIYAAQRLASVLRHQDRWHSLAPASSVCALVMLIGAAALPLARFVPRLRMRFGLYERLFYLALIVWLGIFAVASI